jgi:hypothetical protein
VISNFKLIFHIESFQKVSAPSTSSFTMVDKPSSATKTSAEETESKIGEDAKSMASETGLCEAEAAQFLERRKQTRNVEEELKETYKKATLLDTKELQLPGGKIIGHRQWAKEYNQNLPIFDRKERQVIQKLGIEYK